MLFQKASRLKLRFETPKGQVTVEDLWEISLTMLDAIAVGLFKQIKDGGQESFITKAKGPDEVLQLKFDVVKTVIDTRLKEAELAEQAEIHRQKKVQIMRLINDKENDELREKSVEELRALLADL